MNHELWLAIYQSFQINRPAFDIFFRKNGTNEEWYICYAVEDEERNITIQYDAKINPEHQTLTELSVTKYSEKNYGHGRPSIEEKGLTSSEKKAAKEVFEECFISPYLGELNKVIDKAVASGANYAGVEILENREDAVVYLTQDKKKKRIQKDKIQKAIDYSHMDLSIIRDPEGEHTEAFKNSFGASGYEAIYAIVSSIDPISYPNYKELDKKYILPQLQKAVKNDDTDYLKKHLDFISGLSEKELSALFVSTYFIPDQDLINWMLKNICGENTKYLYTVLLRELIADDKEDIAVRILKEGLSDPDIIDSESYKAPIWEACYKQNWHMVNMLVKSGFYLSQDNGKEFYKSRRLKQLEALLNYRVDLTREALERLIKRQDDLILDKIEEKYNSSEYQEVLLQLYIKNDCFERFCDGLKEGFPYEAPETIYECFEKGGRWVDTLLQYPININKDNGQYLSEAVVNRQYDMVKYLLDQGADVMLHEEYDGSAFHKAVSESGYGIEKKPDERICRLLVKAGADLMEDIGGIPVLEYAFHISADFCCFLIEWLDENNQLDMVVRTKSGRKTPLMVIMGSLYFLQDEIKQMSKVVAKLEEKGIEAKPFLAKIYFDDELRDIFVNKKKEKL